MKELAVVLIIAHKEHLSQVEKRSLKQCHAVLGNYKIVLICPLGLNVSEYRNVVPAAEFDFIDPKWQSDYRMFNRLKIDRLLYERYSQYQFILYYELDAWVFRDDLKAWCNAGYDYIGAPWIKGVEQDRVLFAAQGGNGGFSLRNVEAHVRVLNTWKIMASPRTVWREHWDTHDLVNVLVLMPSMIRRVFGHENNTQYFLRQCTKNEDVLWSVEVNKWDADFKVAPPEVALKFAFERQPALLYKMNNGELPFGCHAWELYGAEFWKAHMNQDPV